MATVLGKTGRLLAWISLGFSAGHAGFAQSPAVEIRSRESRVSLIELHTSEGCSSCPPAEAWLGGLKDAPGLWTDFVPIALHVDYWDHLGWRDPWASRSHADRQRRYAAAWGTGTIYTPELLLNGEEWRDSDGHRRLPSSAVPAAGVLTASSPDLRHWAISFTASDALDGAEAYVALLQSGVQSDIRAGENRGRRLWHDFVVVALTRTSLRPRGAALQGAVALWPDRKPPADAKLALAVWVTRPGHLQPLQAAGNWLPGDVR